MREGGRKGGRRKGGREEGERDGNKRTSGFNGSFYISKPALNHLLVDSSHQPYRLTPDLVFSSDLHRDFPSTITYILQ